MQSIYGNVVYTLLPYPNLSTCICYHWRLKANNLNTS